VADDRRLEELILELLERRAEGATICPSEAARAADPERWRDLMEPARRAARRLVDARLVEITRGGRAVDPATARGPVRIRRLPKD
jgi:hypothetical protein